MNDIGLPRGINGWLLVLCVGLLVWQPVSLALGAAGTLGALAVRGAPAGLALAARLVVAAVGIAAGLALVDRRAGAVTLARSALVLSAAMDLWIYATPYLPNNRTPGDTPLYVAASLAYHAAWLAYLARSKRVRNTFS